MIRAGEGSIIQLDFSSFSLEADYDFLWIYDGDNVYAPKIGRWSTHSPGLVESSGNTMCIEFRSDCGITAEGWEASWTAIDTTPVSPEIIPIQEGVFPNPTDGVFTVKSDRTGFTDVVVYDVYGNKMFMDRFIGTSEIDASGWADGVYVVNFGMPVQMGNVVKLVKVSSPR